jgi:predicted ArsR family transcriptional regulator
MTPNMAPLTASGVGNWATTEYYRAFPLLLGLVERLSVFKALGDNTRYAIYLELARSPTALSTSDIADSLDLHPNTVRPHLERMRDVGLLEVDADSRGTVGRPQHRWSLAPEAPSLGLEPSAFRLLAGLLASVAAGAHADPALLVGAGRVQGRLAGAARASAGVQSCLEALVDELAELGFDPAVADDGSVTTVGFTHCPFRELAEAYPDVVCQLHRGIVEGVIEGVPNAEVMVEAFATLADRDPCRVELISR